MDKSSPSNLHEVSSRDLILEDIEQLVKGNKILILSDDSTDKIIKCREYLDSKLADTNNIIYGINTGFGSLCNIRINANDISQLQHNLVNSHACGTGDEVNQDIVRIILFLKIQNLSLGHSGVSLELVQRMIDSYNNNMFPVIYEQGSLGASGDLAPLAHLSLPLIGEGLVYLDGSKISSDKALEFLRWQPLTLQSKEGLALLNGTQFSSAHATWSCIQMRRLIHFANACAALSLEAFNGRTSPLHPELHRIRRQKGQLFIAREMRNWLAGSDIDKREKYSLQDPYAFRCVPQVHGASVDSYRYVRDIVELELNSVTDNPNIFPEADLILSGGNFHAQPLALVNDFLAMAAAELASISERRTYQLISGLRELPDYLSPDPGINSGLMIPQYTAASIVSQNKQLCTPASVDSIVSSVGQEDHVSMAANAGTKLLKVVENLETVLCIEWMTAAQAISFRETYKLSEALQSKLQVYRTYVAVLQQDRALYNDINKTRTFCRAEEWDLEKV
jgi:histidine ammonia-lyase